MLWLKIAWRNLFRHRGKSLVVGTIILVGAFLLTSGNAVISGMEKGLEKSVVQGFTGDLILMSDRQREDNSLLSMMGKPVEDLPRFDTLRPYLEASGVVAAMVPAGKNFVMALNEDGGSAGYAFLFGVNLRKWRQAFPGAVEVRQGRMPDSLGLVVASGGLEGLYTLMGVWFQPRGAALDTSLLPAEAKENLSTLKIRSDIVFMGFNEANTSADIRRDLDAVIRFKALNKIWGHFLFVDIQSYREAMGYFVQDQSSLLAGTRAGALLAADSLDNLFGDDEFWAGAGDTLEGLAARATAGSYAVPENEEAGIYQLVLTRLRPGVSQARGLAVLESVIVAHHLPVRAVTWQRASGPIGSMTVIIKAALNVFVMFLFFVAIIIIVNTLSMAAMERTAEIGMMRAVGAQKNFVAQMFLGEIWALAAVFGWLGIALGYAAVAIVQGAGITTDNDVLQLFFGGDTFYPVFAWDDLFLTLGELVLVTLLAGFYPVRLARAITPIDAISRD